MFFMGAYVNCEINKSGSVGRADVIRSDTGNATKIVRYDKDD